MDERNADEHLRELIALSRQMVDLADRGRQVREDRGCPVVFGKLRDAAYDLRRMAERELEAHGSTRVPANGPAWEPEDAPARRVLIVEDDPDILSFLAHWFEDLGFSTAVAGNGLQALEKASSIRVDLITLDMAMPEKSGVSTYRDLKDDPLLRSVPVIVITGMGNILTHLGSRSAHLPVPEGFVAKPIDLEELRKTVHRVLAGRPATAKKKRTSNLQP